MKAEVVKELNSLRDLIGSGGEQEEIKSVTKSQKVAVQLVGGRQRALLFHCW